MGRVALKTIVKLKHNMAAIVFSPEGCQLVYADREEGEKVPQHIAIAAATTIALQYGIFVEGLFNFLADVGAAERKEVTH
jgi:hypothetical protein